MMRQHKVSKLPVCSADHHIISLVTSRHMKKLAKYPRASRDLNGCLLVGASVPVGTAPGAAATGSSDTETLGGVDFQRARELVEAGVDVLFTDHGHYATGHEHLNFVRALK